MADNNNINKDNENEEIESDVVILTDEDGNESEFELLNSIEFEGNTYLAFAPLDEDTDEYVILKLVEEDGEETLVTIDDDDEFDRVADQFEDMFMGDFDLDAELEDTENE